MPTYCYSCPACGAEKEVEKSMADSDSPEMCPVDAFVMDRNYYAEQGKQLYGDIWPMASYAAGVSPEEVPEMVKFDKEKGVPTHYNSEGDPVFTSRSHRKRYCEAHHLFDRNGTDKDPLPARCR